MITFTTDNFTVQDCKNNPRDLYIFGDNTIRKGKAGQAVIRDCDNSFGIVTKHYPARSKSSYFIDDQKCFDLVEGDIVKLFDIYKEWDNIIIPVNGNYEISVGTGLAELNTRAPVIYGYICESLRELCYV